MRVLIAGATEARQYVKSYRSFLNILREPGDEVIEPYQFHRGDVTRIRFGDEFLRRKEFDALLLLDLDMIIPSDALQSLRSHDKDMVSGHYFKRGSQPIMSICTTGENWPYLPLYDIPTEGLHEITTSGFGCVLLKREVLQAVHDSLRSGEPMFALGPAPDLSGGDYGLFGSDIRFFSKARQLGYQLWLDASVECLHGVTMWLGRAIYDIMRPHQTREWLVYWKEHLKAYGELHGMDKEEALVRLKQLQEALAQAETQAQRWEDKAKVISGQIAEREFDTKIEAKKPMRPPVLSEQEVRELIDKRKDGPKGLSAEEVKDARAKGNQRHAQDFVDELQRPEST